MTQRIDAAPGVGIWAQSGGADPAPTQRIDSATLLSGRSLAGGADRASAPRIAAAGLSPGTHEEIPPGSDQIHGARGGLGRSPRTGWRGCLDPRNSEAEAENDQDGCSAKDLHHRLLSGGGSPAVSMAAEPDLSGGHGGVNRVDRKAQRVKPQH
jgi:hypothetical protein